MKRQELDTIDQYLAGQLSAKEINDFEQKLREDEKLRVNLEQVKFIIAGIRYSARVDTLEKIKQIENTLPKIEKQEKTTIMRLVSEYGYYAAAACLFIFILGSFYFLPHHGQKNRNKELVEAYFEPYPNVVHPMVRFGEDSLTLVQKAFAEYDRKNYTNAIELFKKDPDFGKDQTIMFYLAIAYLSINDTEKAEENLLSLIDKNPSINDKVKWYLGICYLKENKNNLALKYFKDLSETENYYTQNASNILRKLK